MGRRTGSHIARIDAYACRAPVAKPVATSFGTMRDRPAVFVRIEDGDGCFGWGEVFANWPAAGAEHRVNLLADDLAELVLGSDTHDPSALFHRLTKLTHIRALQCGEHGPFRQVIAGLDVAAHDLVARRKGVPVRTLLRTDAPESVPAYASGIHIDDASEIVSRARAIGFGAFKVKVGFDPSDTKAICSLASDMRRSERLFADANQAFTLDEAVRVLEAVAPAGLGWMEEPMPADAAKDDWRALASHSSVPLAGGENLAGEQVFREAIALGALGVIQPDIAKWGGFTGCLVVARRAIAEGRRFCPHFLGGGIGLAASAHLLAAAGGDGLLEVDVNANPLRDAFGALQNRVSEGHFRIEPGPGLGIERLPKPLGPYITHTRCVVQSAFT